MFPLEEMRGHVALFRSIFLFVHHYVIYTKDQKWK